MADGDRVLVLLGRVQRRIVAQTALQGALLGAAGGLGALTLGLLLLRSTGQAPAHPAALWVGALAIGAALGAGWLVVRRRSSPAAAARRVDAAAGGARDDLVFLALHLRGRTESALAAAAVARGLQRLEEARPAQVAPWRRPRGLGLLGALGAVALGLALWPWPSAAGSAGGVGAGEAAAAGLPAAAVEAVRAELERLQRVAAQLGDAELVALVAQAERLLAQRGPGAAGRAEQAEQLARAAALARQAAEGSEALARAIERVSEILGAVPQTRAWAESLSHLEARASEREARAAAEHLAGASEQERKALADALARAADALRALQEKEKDRKSQERAEQEEQRRRLSGLPHHQAPASGADERGSGAETSRDRNLRRLERDLQDSADACRRDPEACARSLGQAADALGSQIPRARSASERGELARALEEEMARQGQGAGRQAQGPGRQGSGQPAPSGQAAEPRVERGGSRSAGEVFGPGEPGEGGAGGGGEETAGADPSSAGTARAGQEKGAASGAAAGAGEGVGAGPGEGGRGGGKAQTAATRGEKHEIALPSGPGPSRAEVIEGSGRSGFSQPSYRRVYREYESAIEESLDVGAVPPGRRRLVRRYFDLIRPR